MYSEIIVLLIVSNVEIVPIFVTLDGKLTGGIVAAFETSTIMVPGTCGFNTALASIIYAEKYNSICSLSCIVVEAANIFKSHNPDVKNG